MQKIANVDAAGETYLSPTGPVPLMAPPEPEGNWAEAMVRPGNMAVIGSGPTAVYLLKHILDASANLRGFLTSVTILERGTKAGYGMPYHPDTTDVHHSANISSMEIPPLQVSLIDWLRQQSDEALETWRIQRATLNASALYPRLAIGAYLKSQFDQLVEELTAAGIPTWVRTNHEVTGIRRESDGCLTHNLEGGNSLKFDSTIIATGHSWPEKDDIQHGHFFSPWPIFKLLPPKGSFINDTVGILGASLSAFDVVSSLAHRHGTFSGTGAGLTWKPAAGAERFALVLHSAEGWLPHLQFEQEKPLREIYRHVDRDGMLALVDDQGFLRLETYFDKICRPVLRDAFVRDGNEELVELLSDASFGLAAFVARMTSLHSYNNAFEGMRVELAEARESVLQNEPVHWKENIDDLMYTLNFHGELLPAEDHLTFRKVVMPFLMNVIAALPLPSARILLALYEAGILTLRSGRVTVDAEQLRPGFTSVTIDDDGMTSTACYRMFVECGGQTALDVGDYPFQSLVEQGVVSAATARFADARAAAEVPEEKLVDRDGTRQLLIGGVGIDAAYRVLRANGTPEPKVFDLAFPHTSGTRPYSYGLQACSATSLILVKAMVESIQQAAPVEGSLEEVTDLYGSV